MNLANWRSLALAALLAPGASATAQVIDPPPPNPLPPQAVDPNAPQVRPGEDLGVLVSRMAERLRTLGDELTGEIGRDPSGRYLAQDVQELTRSLDDYRESLRALRSDPYRLRQNFAGIDETWRLLHARFSGPVLGIPSVVRAAGRVDEADAQLVAALGLNPAPPAYSTGQPLVPDPARELRRLSHALADRAEAVVAVARVEMGPQPGGGRIIADAANLATVADRFHDAMPSLIGRPDALAANFDAVLGASARVHAALEARGATPGVRSAWAGYRAVEKILRAQIQPVAPAVVVTPAPAVVVTPAPVVVAPAPPPTNLAGPLAASADQMIALSDSFLTALDRAGRRIPEWPAFEIDSQRLRESLVGFRNDAARGVDIGTLANEYRQVDVNLLRLSRRLWRVSRGQPGGPNIDKVKAIGAVSEQIHQLLGMPSYSAGALFPQ